MYRYTRHTIFVLTIISSSIFLFALTFPNYILSYNMEIIPTGFDKNENSVWLTPILISNGIFFSLLIFYKVNKLPYKIINLKNYFQKNDLSRNTVFVIIVSILVFYIVFSVEEFFTEEFEFGDYTGALTGAKEWEKGIEPENLKISPSLRYFFLFLSLEFLGNIRFLPYIVSIGLLILTYFITKEISGKRISGLIGFVTLLQSNLFLLYDTTSTYENFWTFFYMLSLYLIIKNSITSTLSFILTLFLKPLTVLFLPISFFWIIMDKQLQNRKKLFFGFVSISVLIIIAGYSSNLVHTQNIDFSFERMISSINELGNSLMFDGLLIIIFVPVIVLLYLQSKHDKSRKMYVLFGIFVTMISQVMLYGIIDMTIQPYRFIPFVVFIAIGFGLVFSKELTVK